MKSLVRRLQTLEVGQGSPFIHMSDDELIQRMNEHSVRLGPLGFDFPLLDGGPEDAERLRLTKGMLGAITY